MLDIGRQLAQVEFTVIGDDNLFRVRGIIEDGVLEVIGYLAFNRELTKDQDKVAEEMSPGFGRHLMPLGRQGLVEVKGAAVVAAILSGKDVGVAIYLPQPSLDGPNALPESNRISVNRQPEDSYDVGPSGKRQVSLRIKRPQQGAFSVHPQMPTATDRKSLRSLHEPHLLSFALVLETGGPKAPRFSSWDWQASTAYRPSMPVAGVLLGSS